MRDILDDSDVPADALGRVFARTRYSKQAFEHLDALLRMPMDRNHAWGTAFLGEARLGKTTLVAEYLKSCLAGEDGRRPLKHLYVRLTSDAKPATIAYTTLDWIRDPSPAYGGPAQRSSRVWNAIERNRYDIIIYDEAHYLVASDTLTVEEKGVSWFNELLNQRRCPLVLIGYERLGHAIRRNPSLEGRIRPFPACKPLDYADSDDLNEAAYVLSRLERHLDFPTPSGLARRQVAERICYLCGGRLGVFARFLTDAREKARENGHSCLTPDDLLATAARMVNDGGAVRFNPFGVEDLTAALKADGKPADKRR